MGSLPIKPQPYFVNDVICRVSTPTEPGRTDGFSVVEIGVVEYPSTSFSDAGGLRTLEELIRNGFKGDFWVRWGHRSTDTLAHKKFTRERISASDKNVSTSKIIVEVYQKTSAVRDVRFLIFKKS
jgi:hypothetical protein